MGTTQKNQSGLTPESAIFRILQTFWFEKLIAQIMKSVQGGEIKGFCKEIKRSSNQFSTIRALYLFFLNVIFCKIVVITFYTEKYYPSGNVMIFYVPSIIVYFRGIWCLI